MINFSSIKFASSPIRFGKTTEAEAEVPVANPPAVEVVTDWQVVNQQPEGQPIKDEPSEGQSNWWIG